MEGTPPEITYEELTKPDLSQTYYPQMGKQTNVPAQYQSGVAEQPRVIILRETVQVPATPVTPTPKASSSKLFTAFKELGRSIVSVVTQPTTIPLAKTPQAVPLASAPPSEDTPAEPVYSSPPLGGFSLLQMVYNKTPVDVLQRYNCNTDTLIANNMNINCFYDRQYTLSQVHALVPEYSQMRRLGLNVQHFIGPKHWSIVEFSNLYNIPLKALVKAPTGFDMSPKELIKAGLKSVHLKDANITARDLIDRKADFAFWFQLECTPSDFAQLLNGTLNELADMRLSDEQKRSLRANGWSCKEISRVEAFGETTARKFWPDEN